MSLVDDLVNAASGNDVPVATLLRRVKVIASRLGTDQIEEWVDHELVGYPDGAPLPEYRGPFPAQVIGHFSGPFNSEVRNLPIPATGFPSDMRDSPLFEIEFRQPVAQLQELSRSEGTPQASWPANAVAYTNQLIEEGEAQLVPYHGLVAAWRPIPTHKFVEILDIVRTRILGLALQLEEVEPAAGEPGVSVPQPAVQNITNNIYGGSSNIAVASHNVSQVALPSPGDRQALIDYMEYIGVPDEYLESLRQALAEDEEEQFTPDSGRGLGPRVSAWLADLTVFAAKRADHAGVAASGTLAAQALAGYFGIG